MKTVKIPHIYAHYALYQLMYGRELDTKVFEAIHSGVAAEHFFLNSMKKKGELNILELFAGRSEHKQFFMQSCKVPVNKYDCLDNQPDAIVPGVVLGDAVTSKYPGNYNFIIAHYYSLSSCITSRSELVALFKNIYKNLRSNGKEGGFFFHLSPNGYQSALLNVGEPVKQFDFYIPIGHPIRALYGIDPYERDCVVVSDILRDYNRVTCINADRIKNTTLVVKGKVKVKFVIENPFLFRYWSEPEVVDIALEAGFTGFEFYNNSMTDTNDLIPKRSTLANVMKYPDIPVDDGTLEDGDSLESLMTTDMMVML